MSHICKGKLAAVFSCHRFIFLLACIDRWKVYNRLVSACIVKIAIKVECLCVPTSKKRHFYGASSLLIVFLLVCAAINRANLTFRTTIIEDTHLTLAGKQLFTFLPLQTYEKKFSKVSFLYSL